MSEEGRWLPAAAAIVATVTALRVLALAFDQTDLFVDESQYWLWGQSLDFGYYSKPPLIAWTIRAFTAIAGSDAPFFVRLPAPLFHAATALILGALAFRLWGRWAAIWAAAVYVTLPFVAVGSAIISTDTIMAPFFAAGLLFLRRTIETRSAHHAAAAGFAVGVAFLAKYAAVYFLAGIAVAAILAPQMRIGWRNTLVLLAAFALAASPNIMWNLANDLTTVGHTADNIGWVRGGAGPRFDPANAAEFAASQFAVFGPVAFAMLVAAFILWRPPEGRWLTSFAAPPLVIVLVQSFLDKAYANWAVSAYFAGTVIVVGYLLRRAPRVLWAVVAVNAALATLVPILTTLNPTLPGAEAPLLSRYLGRADLSNAAIETARRTGVTTVVATDRDVLADLFYTGRGSGLDFRALPFPGRPRNYYEQTKALPANARGEVLAILRAAPACNGREIEPVATFDTSRGAYRRFDYAAYLLDTDCARSLR